MSNGRSYLTMASAFLAGGLVGAAAGILLTPRSGEHTREMMRRRWRETSHTANELKDRALRRGAEIRQATANLLSGAASALNRGESGVATGGGDNRPPA